MAFGALALLLARAPGAYGDEAGLDALNAGKLFHEAEELFEAGKIPEACARFAESHRLDPKLGTLLNLAFCHEREGRTATAMSEFEDSLRWALQRNQKDRETFAREHLSALEKRLSFLVVERSDASVQHLELFIDGRPWPLARLGVPTAVDPGMHTLVAMAPRKEGQPLVFYVEPGPSTRIVHVPPLLDALTAPPPPVVEAPPADTSDGGRGWALAALGVGGASAVASVVCSIRAASAAQSCAGGDCAAGAGTARDFATAAAVTAGAALLAGGVGFWVLTRPTTSTRAAAPSPAMGIGLSASGVAWAGVF